LDIVLLFLVVLLSAFLYKITNTRRNSPPGPKFMFPIIGQTPLFHFKGEKFFTDSVKKYGKVFRTNLIGRDVIVFQGKEAMKFFFGGQNSIKPVFMPSTIRDCLGEQISTMQAPGLHNLHRKLAAQSIVSQAGVEAIVPLIDADIVAELDRWCLVEKPRPVYHEISRMNFANGWKHVFGTDSASAYKDSYFDDMVELVKGMIYVIPVPGSAWRASRERLCSAIDSIIYEKLRLQAEGKAAELSMANVILSQYHNGKAFTNEDRVMVQDMMLGYLFAAFHTVSSALTSILLFLAQHKDVLDKCRQEQISLGIEKHEKLTLDKLGKMTYAHKVCKEILRLVPPVMFIMRVAESDETYEGFEIPAKTTVIFGVLGDHYDEEVYPDPYKFDPERFEDGNLHPDALWIPFGSGNFQCLGQKITLLKMKMFISSLARNYEWELSPDQDLNIQWLGMAPAPKSGLILKMSHLPSHQQA